MTQKEIAVKISELEAQKVTAQGEKCEVYSRVVGYLRPVALWNEGKKEEFKIRKHYCPCK
ncbi:MAG: anaerobic ribonucleoside-triphosphate reductase [Endomicrobium sp.]|jgi:anaerobic ribonucleoside-triphosphate reductase|nr:anaerobic ribonucleoside-triphosphate reductase [Endomicrobium sp.]